MCWVLGVVLASSNITLHSTDFSSNAVDTPQMRHLIKIRTNGLTPLKRSRSIASRSEQCADENIKNKQTTPVRHIQHDERKQTDPSERLHHTEEVG